MSYFSWLDYSESERNKVLDLVNALGDRDTRDELGIGTVRDAYADLLFPGTSTIQTRARYFLLVPWVYLTIERRLRSTIAAGKEDIAKRLRNEEIGLINYLAASDDPEGTIGIEARKTLKRLPSTVYWGGLSAWGIKLCFGSQDQYNHALHANGPPRPLTGKGSDDSIEADRQNWHPGLPPCPRGFPYTDISFRLTGEEADYLRERIMHNAPGTFLAFLADQGKSGTSVQFPWEHPQMGEVYGKTRKTIHHAQNFSEAIHGAALLYNYLLAKASEHEERIVEYTRKFILWTELIQTRQEEFCQWDREEFWDIALYMNPKIPSQTKSFIDTWFDLALNTDEPQQLLDHGQTENFIRGREHFLKRGQARLQNQRALELWGGAAGTGRLDYRWSTVRTLLADIQKAFTEEPADA